MAKTKEQQAIDAINSANVTLDKLKATATKTPDRKSKKAPKRKTKAKSVSNPTATVQPAMSSPAVEAELVHVPVSGSGIISGQIRGDIGQTPPEAMAQNLVAIQQQQNTVLVSQANKKLDKAIAVDQGLGLQVELQQEKNATIAETVSTQAMKTQQQQAKTSIEGVKLSGLQIDLEGENVLLPHRRESWDIKGQEMFIDNEGARALLPLRREHWGAKLKLAQVGLQKLNIEIQQAQSELYAPLSIAQLED